MPRYSAERASSIRFGSVPAASNSLVSRYASAAIQRPRATSLKPSLVKSFAVLFSAPRSSSPAASHEPAQSYSSVRVTCARVIVVYASAVVASAPLTSAATDPGSCRSPSPTLFGLSTSSSPSHPASVMAPTRARTRARRTRVQSFAYAFMFASSEADAGCQCEPARNAGPPPVGTVDVLIDAVLVGRDHVVLRVDPRIAGPECQVAHRAGERHVLDADAGDEVRRDVPGKAQLAPADVVALLDGVHAGVRCEAAAPVRHVLARGLQPLLRRARRVQQDCLERRDLRRVQTEPRVVVAELVRQVVHREVARLELEHRAQPEVAEERDVGAERAGPVGQRLAEVVVDEIAVAVLVDHGHAERIRRARLAEKRKQLRLRLRVVVAADVDRVRVRRADRAEEGARRVALLDPGEVAEVSDLEVGRAAHVGHLARQVCGVREQVDRQLLARERCGVHTDLEPVRLDLADIVELRAEEATGRRELAVDQDVTRHAVPVRHVQAEPVIEETDLAADLELRRDLRLQIVVA